MKIQSARLPFHRVVERVLFTALMLLGLALRLINLTQPPLDFHPTRQLRSAIIARGMYYASAAGVDPAKREAAVALWASMEQYEPPLFERIVSWGYLLAGGEYPWFARLFSCLFWLVGGAALNALVRRMHSPTAALFALAFFLVLPWGVIATRAFQPDPLMVMLILLSCYTLYRWMEGGTRAWIWTLAAGFCCGLAVLVKAYAIFPLAGVVVVHVLRELFLQKTLRAKVTWLVYRPQLMAFAGLSAAIPAAYYLGLSERTSSFASFWIGALSNLLLDRKFYIHWLGLIHGLMDIMVFFVAVLGTFLYPSRARVLAAGLWLGYFSLGLTFPYQITTHDYYSLILVPVAAIGLAPYAAALAGAVRREHWLWRTVFALALLGVFGYYAWVARSQVAITNTAAEPYAWQKMGAALPTDGAIIGLTHDYGSRLKYYGWRDVHRLWPDVAEINLSASAGEQRIGDFDAFFRQQTAGMDYFLVTLFGDLEAQPALKSMLYDHYPVAQQGDGYILFDLRDPK